MCWECWWADGMEEEMGLDPNLLLGHDFFAAFFDVEETHDSFDPEVRLDQYYATNKFHSGPVPAPNSMHQVRSKAKVHFFLKRIRAQLGYKKDKARPPFTTQQLIACAIAQYPLTLGNIAATIEDSFEYYRHDCSLQCAYPICEQLSRRRILADEIELELGRFNAPFAQLTTNKFTFNTSENWTVFVSGKTLIRSFEPFLRLPSELRRMIYKFALVHESVGIHSDHSPDRATCACPKHDAIGFELFQDGRAIPYADPRQVLALLQVNKQIRAEASPIFYGDNVFDCDSIVALYQFLSNIGPHGRQFVRRIAIGYGVKMLNWTADSKVADRAFGLLNEVPSLKEFTFVFNEDTMTRLYKTINDPTKITGLRRMHDGLREVQRAEFVDCPKIEEYLKDVINQLRIGPIKMYKPRKQVVRKAPTGEKKNKASKTAVASDEDETNNTADAIHLNEMAGDLRGGELELDHAQDAEGDIDE